MSKSNSVTLINMDGITRYFEPLALDGLSSQYNANFVTLDTPQTITGNKTFNDVATFTGSLLRSSTCYQAKEHAKTQIFTPFLLATQSIGPGQPWTQVGQTVTYTRRSARAQLMVTADMQYLMSGSNSDSVSARIVADETPWGGSIKEVAVRLQSFNSSGGGGTRSCVLFPLGAPYLLLTTSVNFYVQVNTAQTDDTITFNPGSNYVNYLRVDEYYEP